MKAKKPTAAKAAKANKGATAATHKRKTKAAAKNNTTELPPLPAPLPEHITEDFIKNNYVTHQKALKLLDTSRTTLFFLREAGKIKAIKINRRVMFSLQEIARFREHGTGGV